MPRPGTINNPTGRGGFQSHPELRSNGRWDKNNSISYWMNLFIRLSVKDFRSWEDDHAESERTVAQSIAYARVHSSRADLKETEFVTNRTEGYPKQPMEHSGEINGLENLTEEELRVKSRELDKKLKENIRGKV